MALAALLVWSIAAAVREPHITVPGDTAPDFAITTARGVQLTSRDFRGRVLVLNFWASWCGPCIQETPSLNAFQSALREAGVVVLGISIDQDQQAYQAFLRDFHVVFETARDPGRKVSASYGTIQIPETYIIDRNGIVAAKVISDQNWMSPRVLQFVQSLL